MSKYEVGTWYAGDEDLDELREKVAEIVDRNVKEAIDQVFEDPQPCYHTLDTNDDSEAVGKWRVSFTDFVPNNFDVYTIPQSIDELVEDIIEDGYLEKIERSHYLFREAWARVFDEAARRIRAAHGEVINDKPRTGKNKHIYEKVERAWRNAAANSGLIDDLCLPEPQKETP